MPRQRRRARRGCAALVLALALAAATLPQPATAGKPRAEKHARWRNAPPPPPAAGSRLFDSEDALSWDSDELQRIQNLHLRAFGSAEEYLAAPHLAAYLGLHAVDALHMSVPLHLVFVGFQGDGNSRVKVSEAELLGWFTHIDHVLPHTRVALSELSCSEDGHCAGQAAVSLPPAPLPSFVHLNVSCNVVAIQAGAVLAAFERAIAAFSRPSDPDAETGDQQVDVLKLEPFVDSFINALGLSSGYTMLVLNPKWSPSLPSYAYRAGFSEFELQLLHTLAHQPEMQPGYGRKAWGPEPEPPAYVPASHSGWPSSIRKFQVTDLQAQSDLWARAASAYLGQLEDHNRKILKMIGPRTKGTAAVARAASLLTDANSELAKLLAASLTLPPQHLHNPRFRATHPLEDCPTPVWVSQSRWLLLDLTARRTDWGPALGGDGVVVHSTLPDVGYAFAQAEEKRAEKRLVKAEAPEEADVRDKLQAMRSQRLASVANAQQHARSMVVGEHLVHGSAPGQVPPESLDPDGQRAPGQMSQGELDALERQHQEALLQAELHVYEEFATLHCTGRTNPPASCAEAADAAADLRHSLALLSKASGSKLALHAEHHWDIFGSEVDDEQVTAVDSAAKDVFFSELAHTLSRGLRHVIAPPSATWHHRGYLHDTASPYAHRVHFTLYLVHDSSRVLGPWRHKGIAFDVDAFKAQLSRLATPHQHFSYSQVPLNLLDDPALASAFAVSLRTSFLQVPHAAADPVENEALYLDSRELAARLRARFDTGDRRVGSADPHSNLEVPVFVFELDRDTPVLIDEHYNARALEDLVLVVQNAANQDEHPTGMMCDGILLQRPLSPLKHALLAVLQHLGGVLPPHLGYNPGRKAVQHDWLWSVGAHPLSWTSWGGAYSQMHVDALHRSYLLDAIDSSVDLVNHGIAALAEVQPSPATFARLASVRHELQGLLQHFAQLVEIWRGMVAQGAVLDYSSAAEAITSSESLARTFLQRAEHLVNELHPVKCVARSPGLPFVLSAAIYGTSVGAGLSIAIVLVAPLFKKKAKAI